MDKCKVLQGNKGRSVLLVGNNREYIKDSTLEECCMSCYFKKNCVSWQHDQKNQTCTLTSDNNDLIVKSSVGFRKNILSGNKS